MSTPRWGSRPGGPVLCAALLLAQLGCTFDGSGLPADPDGPTVPEPPGVDAAAPGVD